MLKACALKYGKSWDKSIPYAQFSYNNSYQASIEMAPFEADNRVAVVEGFRPYVRGDCYDRRAGDGDTFEVRIASMPTSCTTRNLLIYDEFLVTISENIINMHDM
jgi:hypothetical protein